MPPAARPVPVLLALCAAEVLSMAGFATWPAVLPLARAEWGLQEAGAGVVSGALFAGYLAAALFLTSATDTTDARRVYAIGCCLATLGCLGVAKLAEGPLGASLFQGLVGVGLAGTYMPGLKAFTDRVGGSSQLRLLAWYTSFFGVGSAASLLLAGACASRWGWRSAFAAAALGPPIAAALVLGLLAPVAASGGPRKPALQGVGLVVRSRPVMAWVGGYASHCWQLFGLRSWVVAFLAHASGGDTARAAAAAALIQLLGPPSSIAGNEWALRVGRRRVVLAAMVGSGAGALALGFASSSGWVAVVGLAAVHYIFVMADSAALTAGVVAASEPGRRGATLAVHSVAGFGAGCLAPIAFGAALQSFGGTSQPRAWLAAFATLAFAELAGCAALARWSSRAS
jgi:MFS family permease